MVGNLVAPDIHNNYGSRRRTEYSDNFTWWRDGHEEFVEIVKDNQQFILENVTYKMTDSAPAKTTISTVDTLTTRAAIQHNKSLSRR